MSQTAIKSLLEHQLQQDGLFETLIPGIQFFRFTKPRQCAPVVYVPTVIAIVSGAKEAIFDGQSNIYDSQQYLCCTMTMPVKGGISSATPEQPLLGISINIDNRIMTEIVLELNSNTTVANMSRTLSPGLTSAKWNTQFENALLRLVQIANNKEEAAILGLNRIREVYYAILKGEAGPAVQGVFGTDNGIHRAIHYLTEHFNESISIEDLTSRIGMSRAVFHRKFKETTNMSPIQFLKAIRLNSAAMLISQGNNVQEASATVGYTSPSQFSREFKRMFGTSPKQWSIHQ